MANDRYWIDRNEAEKQIVEELKRDEIFRKNITELYQSTLDDIQNDLDRELGFLANKESVSLADAQKTIKKTDVNRFSRLAKRMTNNEDFSDLANKYLRRYNVTMRTSRLELMQAYINAHVTNLANAEEIMTTGYLTETAERELVRQSGILNESAPSKQRIATVAKAIVTADFQGVKFSDRIWSNQDDLQADLYKAVRQGLIQGKNPRVTAREIKRNARDLMVGSPKKNNQNAKYVAERLAITESARVQTSVQKETFKTNGYTEYEYIAEPTACHICHELDGKIFKVSEMESGVNASPMHPFCRCSTASHMAR